MNVSDLTHKIKDLFRLDTDIDRVGTVRTIREGVVFRGTNVWSLIFAIFIASIGLNLNSTAVIIGAMLISPLMGPITGAGMALAIYDLSLFRKALAYLALMTVAGLVVSTLYFWLSPLGATTPEILSRTAPTFYDVLIAALGGGALMVGLSRKNRSANIMAGVAIATALMPPLCTAGFGLANRNLAVFAGAFYLYLINSVFIGLVTYVFSKALRLKTPPKGDITDTSAIRKRQLWITVAAVVVFVTPSIFMAYDVVRQSEWHANLTRFEDANLTFANSQVLSTKVTGSGDNKTLEIAIVGAPLSADLKAHLAQVLPQYGLGNLKLLFVQNTEQSLAKSPKAEGVTANSEYQLVPEVTREVDILFPALANLAWGNLTGLAAGDNNLSIQPTAFARWSVKVTAIDQDRLDAFLRLRLRLPTLKVVHEVLKQP